MSYFLNSFNSENIEFLELIIENIYLNKYLLNIYNGKNILLNNCNLDRIN